VAETLSVFRQYINDVIRSTRHAAVFSLSLAVLLSACRTSTQPSSGSPSGSPGIISTSPSQPSLSDTAQSLFVTGHDFDQGLVGTLMRPGGSVLSLSSTDMKNLTSSSFQLSVVFDVSGDYQLQVKNVNGLTSAPYTIPVRPAAQGTLTLISVSPSTVVVSSQLQGIFVTGTNFDSTLEAIITGPDSLSNFYTSASMAGLTSTSFSMNAVFDKVGVYNLSVRNGSNAISNLLTIDVRRTF
jgi:hypothetical protein